MTSALHLDTATLEAGLDHIRQSPQDVGTIEMIIRRPGVDQREELEEAEVDLELGVVGDTWKARESISTPDGSPNPDSQVTIMNARVIDLVAQGRDRWSLAGDQFYADLDLGRENLPPGTRLQLGSAVVEVSEIPHTGCAKFSGRFGADALRFVNTGPGRELSFRGINTRVVVPGLIRRADQIKKL
ncbi:MAG TPA: MOSC domain-containing protein [Acidimicrobiia bacterium]|nr:MOSC domain-containing protein [Acidimicrobiia bacterium]